MDALRDEQHRRRALALFADLVERTAAEREAALAAPDLDPVLRVELARLLQADARTGALDRGVGALVGAALPAGPDPRLGRHFGVFRLDSVLGEGGMGTVFRARRTEGGFEQQVALKLIRGGVDGSAARRRFERERAILARLDHPDLAPLLDGGVAADGTPWYAMPLIDGAPITAWCDAHAVGLRERVALLARVCDAVQSAHQALVVHRDLKPSNVLVDARGAPRVLDFGIAKLLDEEDEAHTVTRLMTPAYAAPEQIRGEPVSTATDVFALGVMLYELACGRHPFGDDGPSSFALQRAVIEREPRRFASAVGNTDEAARAAQQRQCSPARLRRALRGDFERIVRRALAKLPGERYGSAAALGDDLRRWLAGEPVLATPPSLRYRAQKFVSRWRWPLAGAALIALALLASTTISLRQARLAVEAQRAAEASAQSAQAAQDFLQKVFLAAEPWRNEGNAPTALQLANRAFETLDEELAGQPQARADLYASLVRMYSSTGDAARAIAAGERAVALYEQLSATPARRFDVQMQLAYAYGYGGRLDDYAEAIERAGRIEGIAQRQRYVLATSRAQLQRDRGHYDSAVLELQQAFELGRATGATDETAFALGNSERMLRRYRDAAQHLLLQDQERDNSGSRGWRALMAIYRFELLPAAQRRPDDLQLAARLEAERAAVFGPTTWIELFTALRARLHLQHGDLPGALALARALPLEPAAASSLGGYDAESWLALGYVLLQGDAADRAAAAARFEAVGAALQRYSGARDPRPGLVSLGLACARGTPLDATQQALLQAPPLPDYLGYAWLAEAPCAALRDSTAARHPAPQPRAHGAALRAAIDQAAARIGECNNGRRVGPGGSCGGEAPAAP